MIPSKSIPLDRLAVAASSRKKEEKYWLEKLSGQVKKNIVPFDYPVRGDTEEKRPKVTRRFSDHLSARLITLSTGSDPLLHLILAAGLALVLHKYTRENDIILGTPIYRQPLDAHLVNKMLALRITIRDSSGFREFLLQLRQTMMEAVQHQAYPIEILVKKLGMTYIPDQFPLFDIVILLENIQDPAYISPIEPNLVFSFIKEGEHITGYVTYNPRLYLEITPRQILSHLEQLLSAAVSAVEEKVANLNMISEKERYKLLFHFNDTAAGYPKDKTLHQLLAAQVERIPDHIALLGPGLAAPGDNDALPLQPDRDVRSAPPVCLTYGELHEKSNRLAYALVEKGIKPDTIVGIMVERSVEMIVGIFGILKAGGAYLPIDPDYPQKRIDYMLKDSNAGVLLTTAKLRVKVKAEAEDNSRQPQGLPLQFITIERNLAATAESLLSTLTSASACRVSPANLAYVIYTSGSTGRPKGVMMAHYSLVNRLHWMQEQYPLRPDDIILQKTPFTFDVSVWEIFWWGQQGAGLVLLAPGGEKDPGIILWTIERYQVSVIHFVPSMLKAFLIYVSGFNCAWQLSPLRRVFASGEALTPSHADLLAKVVLNPSRPRLSNLYGPTETCVDVTFYDCSPGEKYRFIPIGKPIANTQLYILDMDKQLLPLGVSGELYIGGHALARGYLNRPALTAERFNHDLWDYRDKNTNYKLQITNKAVPFGQNENAFGEEDAHELHELIRVGTTSNEKLLRGVQGGGFLEKSPPGGRRQRVYKTGDIARWLADGNVQFLGRKDHQVKIRGFRIETGEIESHLLQYGPINQAVVTTGQESGDDDDKYLAAYFTSEKEVDIMTLREFLLAALPSYFVPSYFMRLQQIPLTANGKVDRQALPRVKGEITGLSPYEAPRDELETDLVNMWQELLGCDRIGIGDNFFQRGGHSLKAINLLARINEKYRVNLDLSQVFKNPTIKALSQVIAGQDSGKYTFIPAAEAREYYPLSSAQKRLYTLYALDQESTAYNIPGIYMLEIKMNRSKLESIFQEITRRHEAFRTSFAIVGREVVQRIHPAARLQVHYREIASGETPQNLQQWIKPFDLSGAPLLRISLAKIKGRNNRFLLQTDMHHIISDGLSLDVLLQDFILLYQGKEMKHLPVQYKDFTLWQNQYLGSEAVKKQESYWLKRFAGEIPHLNLPMDFSRPTVQSFEGDVVLFNLEEAETSRLKKLAGYHRVTIYMFLLAIYNALLARYTGQEDIVVGTPQAGRQRRELEGVIGMFVNSLAIRNFPSGEKRFTDFLGEVKQAALEAYENQDYQFETLVEKLQPGREASNNPLFDTMFVLQDFLSPGPRLEGLEDLSFKPVPLENKTAKFDLELLAAATGNQLAFSFHYSTKLFKSKTVERLRDHFLAVIRHVLRSPGTSLGAIEIMSPTEQEEVLSKFNQAPGSRRVTGTLHGLFAARVEKDPDAIALALHHQQLSYGFLNGRGNALARFLRECGVKPDTTAAIAASRSLETVVGIIAILKSGGAYLPIEPTYPLKRIEFMLNDSRAVILAWQAPFPPPDHIDFKGRVIDLHQAGAYADNPTRVNTPGNLAYIIYTPGSTGKPNGVMIEHRGVINLIDGLKKKVYREYTGRLNISMVAPPVFDASVQQLFGGLLSGHRVVVVPPELVRDGGGLLAFYHSRNIQITDGTPSHLRMMLESAGNAKWKTTIKHFLIAGEELPKELAQKFYDRFVNKDFEISNICGVTEVSVDSTIFTFGEKKLRTLNVIPIGKPLPNQQVYILSRYNSLQPPGVTGELCYGGDGLGRGYLNNPGLTAEKFNHDLWDYRDKNKNYKLQNTNYKQNTKYKLQITNKAVPFGQNENAFGEEDAHELHELIRVGTTSNEKLLQGVQGGGFLEKSPPGRRRQRVYKTGDLARWLPDGNIEFKGRMDSQVKIRGFRVELGEIQRRLQDHPDISEVAVITKNDRRSGQYLIAYYMSPREFHVSELRDFLSVELPNYMIPAYFVRMTRWPVISDGQVDKTALLTPKGKISTTARIKAPRDGIEARLVELWEEVLRMHDIGMDDNFFEVGGHSLSAVILVALIHQHFNVKIPLAQLFALNTVEKQAQYIGSAVRTPHYTIVPVEKKEYYPLASPQKRLYSIYLMDPHSLRYNNTITLVMEGEIPGENIEDVLYKMIRRHETLRTSLQIIDNTPMQRIHQQVNFVVQSMKTDPGNIKKMIEHFIQPFDLGIPPLIRVGLLEISQSLFILMADIHHIINDAFSLNVFIKDFSNLFNKNEELQPLRLHYKDYAEWQAVFFRSNLLKKQEAYWLSQFRDEAPVLNIPTDFPRPALKCDGDTIRRTLKNETHEKIKKIAQQTGTTPYMIFLALFHILLHKYTGQTDIVIGSPVSGRTHSHLNEIIGMFVNMVPMRVWLKVDQTFGEFLQEVRQRTLAAFENQDYPFEYLVRQLKTTREPGRNPLFDFAIFFLEGGRAKFETGDVIIKSYPFEVKKVLFDLVLGTYREDDKIILEMEYSTELFKSSTVEKITGDYLNVLEQAVENPGLPLKDIKLPHDFSTVDVNIFKDDYGDFNLTDDIL